MEITYLKGDATEPVGNGHKFIVHVCNDVGAWGKGFVLAISKKWKQPARSYHRMTNGFKKSSSVMVKNNYNGIIPLGTVQKVDVEDDVSVLNMVAQNGIYPKDGVPPIRYDSLEVALNKVATICQNHPGSSVHAPRIGAGLAGGKWDKIEEILNKTLSDKGIPVFVYDLPDSQ